MCPGSVCHQHEHFKNIEEIAVNTEKIEDRECGGASGGGGASLLSYTRNRMFAYHPPVEADQVYSLRWFGGPEAHKEMTTGSVSLNSGLKKTKIFHFQKRNFTEKNVK